MIATAAHLRGSLAALAAQPSFAQDQRSPAMFWGKMETFHWNSVKSRPIGFAQKYGGGRARTECVRRHLYANSSIVRPEARTEHSGDAWRSASGIGHLIGPFNFAKGDRRSRPLRASAAGLRFAHHRPDAPHIGPMYFVSHRLVAQLNVDGALQRQVSATVRSANDSRNEKFLPWEDVFTGMALAQSATGGALASVHMPMALYAEGWQFATTPSVLLWHMKSKIPDRIVEVERWSSQQQPCVPSAVTLTCGNTFTSCNGQKWLRCLSPHNNTACSTKRVRLNSTKAKVTRPEVFAHGPQRHMDKLRGAARAASSQLTVRESRNLLRLDKELVEELVFMPNA